jgi:hypothetical protein
MEWCELDRPGGADDRALTADAINCPFEQSLAAIGKFRLRLDSG